MVRRHYCRAVDEARQRVDKTGRQEADDCGQHEVVPVSTKQFAIVIIDDLARRSARGDIDLVAIMLGTIDAVMPQMIEALQVIGDAHERRHHLAHTPVPPGGRVQQSVYRLMHHDAGGRREQQGG
ncbi:hypothetical protein D3C81_1950990 [compost metagenome]